jgi:phospholipid/cholesterol/gamma-HCH transport system substrate-binding protein
MSGRRPSHSRRWASLLAVGSLAILLAACRVSGSGGGVTVSAVFSDVGDLVTGAPVQLSDVPIGQVTRITLDGDRARVTMAFDHGVSVPENVTAKLERTTILGQRFIELASPVHAGPPLATGSRVTRTEVVPTVEQLVSAGAQVFGSVSTSQLAQIIATGGQGFAGQAASLRQLLNDLSSVTAGYAAHTSQISTTITSLDQLGTSLAPDAGTDAQALTNLSQTVAVLARQSSRFENLLTALNGLSVQGKSLLSTYYPQITTQLRALNAVSGQLALNQQNLAGLLEYLPMHDAALSASARNDYLQILENIIVCGIPAGGSNPSPAFTCTPKGGG